MPKTSLTVEIGAVGDNGCGEYLTAAQCEAYANAKSTVTWNREDSWSDYPIGCFTANEQIYFNQNQASVGGNGAPVCKTLPDMNDEDFLAALIAELL
jgi:hypothetical protein